MYKILLVVLFLVLGVSFFSFSTDIQPDSKNTLTDITSSFTAQPARAKTIIPDLSGSDGVGIVVDKGNHVDAILSQFTFETLPCDPEATSTTCTFDVVKYQGDIVKVYAIVPFKTTERKFYDDITAFPFSGKLIVPNDMTPAEMEARLIQMIAEGGNATYTIIYE